MHYHVLYQKVSSQTDLYGGVCFQLQGRWLLFQPLREEARVDTARIIADRLATMEGFLLMQAGHSPLRLFSNSATLKALYACSAMAEFSPQGVFLNVSPTFLRISGYARNELIGRHHSILLTPEAQKNSDYAIFWNSLRQGQPQSGEFHRLSKNGTDFWVEASYMPVRAANGKVVRVVKLAYDISQSHKKSMQDAALLRAITRSQATIRFKPDGTILDANDVFLKTMDYTLEEIKGKHHSLFVEPQFGNSPAYEEFWKRLTKGEFFVASYHRLAKNNRDVWLQASYNPVFDDEGNVVEVVKIASDTTPLHQGTELINQALNGLSQGDLCAQIGQPLTDSLDPIRTAFNASVSALRLALSDVLVAAEAIRQDSKVVNVSANQLSQRTEQQVMSLEKTSSSLQQITGSVQSLTNSTGHMRGVTKQANEEASSSSTVIDNAVRTMEEIDKHSAQISNIVGVIDEIALQTNLLALNAGVEAARAGDAGRGFAVVATEVRALAQRSAEAAKEIKTLIGTSNKVISAGVASVTDARQSLTHVADCIRSLDQSIDAAATGAQEQSQALLQVNEAVREIDKMTQANATMAEETATASQSLAQGAEDISGLLQRFKVSQDAFSQDSFLPQSSMLRAAE